MKCFDSCFDEPFLNIIWLFSLLLMWFPSDMISSSNCYVVLSPCMISGSSRYDISCWIWATLCDYLEFYPVESEYVCICLLYPNALLWLEVGELVKALLDYFTEEKALRVAKEALIDNFLKKRVSKLVAVLKRADECL